MTIEVVGFLILELLDGRERCPRARSEEAGGQGACSARLWTSGYLCAASRCKRGRIGPGRADWGGAWRNADTYAGLLRWSSASAGARCAGLQALYVRARVSCFWRRERMALLRKGQAGSHHPSSCGVLRCRSQRALSLVILFRLAFFSSICGDVFSSFSLFLQCRARKASTRR